MADAGFEVVVTSNARDVARWVDDIVTKQIPFATAVALTRVAQFAQSELKRQLPKHFTIRNKRVPNGIRIVRAEKRDWPNCRAYVGSIDNFMKLQVTGGPKTARGGGRVAIPSRIAIGTRNPGGSIPSRLKPRALVAGGQGFVREDIQTIFRRSGKLKNRTSNLGIVRFFKLVKSQQIKARWPMREEVQAAAFARYGMFFKLELEAAIRSRRMRAGSFSSEQGQAAYLSASRRVVSSALRGI